MGITNKSKQQTLFDIALQMYGDIEGVIWILEDNPEVDFNTIGSTILLRQELVKSDIVKYLKEKKISISTRVEKTVQAIEETHNEFTFEFNFEFN